MKLWRISNYADLLGIGGLHVSGRWHYKGNRVVYLAENPALAQLEVMVHFDMDLDELPDDYTLLEVEVNKRCKISTLDAAALPANWQKNEAVTQHIGTQWLHSSTSALLRVPSAVVPHSNNYLLNPEHKDAKKIKLISDEKHPWDDRLLK